jgi:hypothetical protein
LATSGSVQRLNTSTDDNVAVARGHGASSFSTQEQVAGAKDGYANIAAEIGIRGVCATEDGTS